MPSMPQYPNNSHTARTRQRKKAVVQQSVGIKKPDFLSRIRSAFIGDEAESVGAFVLFEVLIPATKNALVEMVTQGAQKVFGDTRSSTFSRGPAVPYVNYNNYYSQAANQPQGERSRGIRQSNTVEAVLFRTREDATNVLMQLEELIANYGMCSVADYYDFVGLNSEITDEGWGWVNIPNPGPHAVNGGFTLNLPRPRPL